MLMKETSCLVLIDVQGKLAEMVHDSDVLVKNIERLVQAAKIFDVPVIWLEQYPKGLGPTVASIAAHLEGQTPIEKMEFDACLNPEFMVRLNELDRKQVVVCGIESHICVFQTAAHLKELGYHVEAVVDAVSSRTAANKAIGLDKMKAYGVLPTSTESVIYELMKKAGTPEFKQVLPLIK